MKGTSNARGKTNVKNKGGGNWRKLGVVTEVVPKRDGNRQERRAYEKTMKNSG